MKTKILIAHLCVLIALLLHFSLGGVYDLPPQARANTIPSPSPLQIKESVEQIELSDYFKRTNCQLGEFTKDFIDTARRYSLDFRLLPALAVQESNCGRNMYGFNPFGFGSSHFKEGKYHFTSILEALDYVGSALAGESDSEKGFVSAQKDTMKILWIYNGTINQAYPEAVWQIMQQIQKS